MGRREQFLREAVIALQQERIKSAYIAGDVRSPEDGARAVQTALTEFGALHILINSAAGNFLANAHELSTKGFRTVMEIDTIGTFNMCTAAFPSLREAAGAVIVNVSATLHYGMVVTASFTNDNRYENEAIQIQ